MSRRILRWAIPVDDHWHRLALTGPVIHVASRGDDSVEVWVIDNPGEPEITRTFRVYGTGQPDLEGKHVGSAVTPSARFVWHLMEDTKAGASGG